jgi:hypothetical protein
MERYKRGLLRFRPTRLCRFGEQAARNDIDRELLHPESSRDHQECHCEEHRSEAISVCSIRHWPGGRRLLRFRRSPRLGLCGLRLLPPSYKASTFAPQNAGLRWTSRRTSRSMTSMGQWRALDWAKSIRDVIARSEAPKQSQSVRLGFGLTRTEIASLRSQ